MTKETYNFNIILNIRPVFLMDINIFKTFILGYSILYLLSFGIKIASGDINIQMQHFDINMTLLFVCCRG